MQIECTNKKKALKAVNKNKNGVLRYCSEELKNDKDVCMAALERFGDSEYKFIGYNLKQDKDIQILYLEKGGDLYNITLQHKEVCFYAISKKSNVGSHLSTELKNDKDVCMAMVSKNGSNLYYCSTQLRDDRDICLAAVKNSTSSFVYCSDRMKADVDICLLAAQSTDKGIMKDIPDNSIDCIITDLPYGTTGLKWDSIIPFDLLWNQYNKR